MKIRSFILVLFLAVAAMAQAQLPSVTLKDINGKTESLPPSAKCMMSGRRRQA